MNPATATSHALKNGDFCWVEAATSDVPAAKAFYGALFGWSATDGNNGGMEYTMLASGGVAFGGLYGLMPDQLAQRVPPHWMPYVRVASVQDTVARARKSGGSVIVEFCELPGTGRLAVLQDPSGAHVSVWEPLAHEGAPASALPGRPSWFELMSNDRAQALPFYRAVFGWTTSDMDMGPMGTYTLLHNGRPDPVGGCMQIGPECGGMPSYWSLYFTVADCDASAARAQQLGGKLCHGPMDVPGVGRFAFLSDPAGATFAIIAYPATA
jgi:predicted enzyme related to lactoylglutathione lyase